MGRDRTLVKVRSQRLAQTTKRLRQSLILTARNTSQLSGPRSCLPRGCIARLRSHPPRSGIIAPVRNCRSSGETPAGSEYRTRLPRSAAGSLRSTSPRSIAPAQRKRQWTRPRGVSSRSQHRPNQLCQACQARKSGAQPLHPRFGYPRKLRSRTRTRGVADWLDAMTSGGSGCLRSTPWQDFKPPATFQSARAQLTAAFGWTLRIAANSSKV